MKQSNGGKAFNFCPAPCFLLNNKHLYDLMFLIV